MAETINVNYDAFKKMEKSNMPNIDKYIKDDYDLTSQELLIIKQDAAQELLNFKKEIDKEDTQIATGDDLIKLRKMVENVLAKKDDNTDAVAAAPAFQQNTEAANQGKNTTTSEQKTIEKKEDKRDENEIKESINKKIDEYIKVANKISKKDLSKITDSIGSALEEEDLQEYHNLLKAFKSDYISNLSKLRESANNNNLIIDLNDNQQIKFPDNKTKLLYIEEQLKIIEEIWLDEVWVFFTVKTWTKDNIWKIIWWLIALWISWLIIYKIYALGQKIISKAKNLFSGGGDRSDIKSEEKKDEKEKEKQKKVDKTKETKELRQSYIEEIKTQVKLAWWLDKEGRLTPQAEKIINNLDELKDSTKLGTMKEYKFIKRVGSMWADEIQITRIKHLPWVKTVAKFLPETVLNKPVRTKLPGPSHWEGKIKDLNNQLKAKTWIKDTSNNKFKKEIDDFIKKGEEYFKHNEDNLLWLNKKRLFQIYIHELLHDSKTNPTQAEFYRTINSIIDNWTINKNHGNANKPNFEVAPIETPIKVRLSDADFNTKFPELTKNYEVIEKYLKHKISKATIPTEITSLNNRLANLYLLPDKEFVCKPSELKGKFLDEIAIILWKTKKETIIIINRASSAIARWSLLTIDTEKFTFLESDSWYKQAEILLDEIKELEKDISKIEQDKSIAKQAKTEKKNTIELKITEKWDALQDIKFMDINNKTMRFNWLNKEKLYLDSSWKMINRTEVFKRIFKCVK